MRERPIIFSTEMVRAILDRRKTQTRRVIKPQPVIIEYPNIWAWQPKRRGPRYIRDTSGLPGTMVSEGPYRVGDHLWVRETWSMEYNIGPNTHESGTVTIGYRASPDTFSFKDAGDIEKVPKYKTGWRSPIFMPRWACQLMLEVTNVRAEQLQDVSYSDIIAEGVQAWLHAEIARETFGDLWDSLNKKRGFGWAGNPWVRAVEFKVLEP